MRHASSTNPSRTRHGRTNTRTIVLLVLAALIAVALIADRTGILHRVGQSESGNDATEYREKQRKLTRRTAFLEEVGRWRDALDTLEQRAREAAETAVVASTEDLAESKLRETVLDEIGACDIQSPSAERSSTSRVPTADGEPRERDTGVRVLTLELRFDAPSPEAAFCVVDRLENMPELRLNIDSLDIQGPGRRQTGGRGIGVTTATLYVRALAVVEERDAGATAEADGADAVGEGA